MAFDAAGNLYVANEATTTVSVFAPGSTTASVTINLAGGQPDVLKFDSSGNLYVSNLNENTVSVFAPGESRLAPR